MVNRSKSNWERSYLNVTIIYPVTVYVFNTKQIHNIKEFNFTTYEHSNATHEEETQMETEKMKINQIFKKYKCEGYIDFNSNGIILVEY